MSKEHLIPFKKGQSGNPKGRPKKTITELKNMGLSKDDAYAAISLMLLLSKKDLLDISKSEAHPIWKVCIARAIIKDHASMQCLTVESLFDRLFGRAKQETAIGGIGGEAITGIEITYAKPK